VVVFYLTEKSSAFWTAKSVETILIEASGMAASWDGLHLGFKSISTKSPLFQRLNFRKLNPELKSLV